MPAIAFYGCKCSGHLCWGQRKNDQASEDVFVNGLGIHRVGDHWDFHRCGKNRHDGVLTDLVSKGKELSENLSTVFVNGKKIGRIGDYISCDQVIKEGSPDCFNDE